MRATLLPLRSNAAWFADEQSLDGLRCRLKTALMLYDEVYLQDGRYQCTVSANGTMETFLGANTLGKFDRNKISFAGPGREVSLFAVPGPFKPGQPIKLPLPQAFFDADFFPLIEESGFRGHAALKLINGDWNKEITVAGREALQKHQASLVGAQADGSKAQKFKWAEVFILDSLAAHAMKVSITTDSRAGPLVDYFRALNLSKLEGDQASVLLAGWITLGLPDFGAETWPSLLAKRDSAAGKSFRSLIGKLEVELAREAGNFKNQADIEVFVRKLLVKELIDELMNRRTSWTEASVNVGLNFVPFGGVASAKDLWDAYKEGRSWISLLAKK